MGLTYVEATVTGPTGTSRTPTKVWKAIKLKPKKRVSFILADGTTIERNMSECHIALDGEDGHTPIILGEPGDDPLLGVITLENLGLILDPFKRELRPMKLRLG
jgi:predicted aspartyl protease